MDPNYLNPSNRPSSLVRMLVLSGKCECVESVPGMVPGIVPGTYRYLFAVYVVMKLPNIMPSSIIKKLMNARQNFSGTD